MGGIYRFAAREFFSPFIRGTVGVLINNQSPISLTGQTNRGSVLVIYDDDNPGTRLRPAFELGVGSTIATSPAYQIRWEVRDNIVGVQEVTGPVTLIGGVPPPRDGVQTSVQHTDRLRRGARAERGEGTERSQHVRGAILAGGGATRFGGKPKGLEMVGGERILDRLVRTMAEALGEPPLLVANAPDAAGWRPDLRVVATCARASAPSAASTPRW